MRPDAVAAPSTTPTPRFSCIGFYRRRQDAEFLQRCDPAERMYIYGLDARTPFPTVGVVGHPTEEARILSLREDRDLVAEPSPKVLNNIRTSNERRRRERENATAIRADETYSYSATRRGTCSHHGGVAHWLSR